MGTKFGWRVGLLFWAFVAAALAQHASSSPEPSLSPTASIPPPPPPPPSPSDDPGAQPRFTVGLLIAVCVGVFVVGIFVAFAVVVIARGSTGYAVTVQLEERHQAPQFDSTGVELEYATGYAQQHTGAVYSSDDSNADADNRRLM
eukprot:TRINITY_DN9193_c1_g1_i1.p1 TRINITY_DN9193_c1_g1~~TRINITY_DN9193_c1_g1_i1.p1  ORF type:complete len:145 (-),score=13.58 TRINITY_DN9193_c1_g1_i1:62-496(-)